MYRLLEDTLRFAYFLSTRIEPSSNVSGRSSKAVEVFESAIRHPKKYADKNLLIVSSLIRHPDMIDLISVSVTTINVDQYM